MIGLCKAATPNGSNQNYQVMQRLMFQMGSLSPVRARQTFFIVSFPKNSGLD